MPTSGSGRDARRSSKSGSSGDDAQRSSERREKAKSSQTYSAAYSNSRRGSVQPTSQEGLGSVPERPRVKTRTNSAPLIEVRKAGGELSEDQDEDAAEQEEIEARDFAAPAGGGAMADGQDEDEVAGVVGALRQYHPFQSPEVCISYYVFLAFTGTEAKRGVQCRSQSPCQKSTSR